MQQAPPIKCTVTLSAHLALLLLQLLLLGGGDGEMLCTIII